VPWHGGGGGTASVAAAAAACRVTILAYWHGKSQSISFNNRQTVGRCSVNTKKELLNTIFQFIVIFYKYAIFIT